jgi:hypothetical protein
MFYYTSERHKVLSFLDLETDQAGGLRLEVREEVQG